MKHLSATTLARTPAKAGLCRLVKMAPGGRRLGACPRWWHLLGAARNIPLRVPDAGMEPTLAAGAAVMVDPAFAEWEPCRIFAVQTAAGTVVARAAHDAAGRPVLVHDNPAWPDLPWPAGARIVGRVCSLSRGEE